MQEFFGGSLIGEKHMEDAVHEEQVKAVTKVEPVAKR